jgi:hypothetical protein
LKFNPFYIASGIFLKIGQIGLLSPPRLIHPNFLSVLTPFIHPPFQLRPSRASRKNEKFEKTFFELDCPSEKWHSTVLTASIVHMDNLVIQE